MNEDLDILTIEIDSLVLDLLGPLRTSKTINQMAFTRLKNSIEKLGPLLESRELVPKKLVGTLFFIFTSILSEAEHAKNNKDEIEFLAWDIQERLENLLGPKY